METRNPMLALPGVQRLAELDPHQREILVQILSDIRHDARARAELSWKRHKGPMACYWRALSTYAGHLARAVRHV